MSSYSLDNVLNESCSQPKRFNGAKETIWVYFLYGWTQVCLKSWKVNTKFGQRYYVEQPRWNSTDDPVLTFII